MTSNRRRLSFPLSTFDDVAADAYYAPYITWAAQQGIVGGNGAQTFAVYSAEKLGNCF